MTLIWATRGRSWGFRFLLRGPFEDPLTEYERVFSSVEGSPEVWRRAGGTVALRFPDPLGRKDAAGRVIPHDFVVYEPLAGRVGSVKEGIQAVWPLVADDFARVWDLANPPAIDPETGISRGKSET